MKQVSSITFGPCYGSLCFSAERPTLLRFTHYFKSHSTRAMASHIVGLPRIGPKRELKFALESFWDGKSSAEELQNVAAGLRSCIWKQLADAGIKYIPSNTFSYYDQMLDTTAMLGAVPPRYGWKSGEVGLETYFSMARGNAHVPAMEMTKWFDTNYHYIVPELGPHIRFSYASHKAVDEFKEAKALGLDTVPVLIGPVSYLLLSKPARGTEQSFPPLSLLRYILPVYKEVVAELKAAGATWIQFDEPTLVWDLDANQLHAFAHAYSELESSLSGLNVLIETYFADVTAEAYKTLTSLKGVTGYGFDLIRGEKTLDLINDGFPSGKHLFAGVVDGRNIWANDLASSLRTLQALEGIVGKDKIVVSTSCSLLHTAVDIVNETELDKEVKSWLAFAAQKVVEVNALAKALSGHKDEAFFSINAAAQASRKSSPKVTNEAVQKAAAALKGSDLRRATNVTARLDAQQKKLNLPILPTTTIGSFPQTIDVRRVRREFKDKKISEEDYVNAMKEEINKVVKLQEELDIDVLVTMEVFYYMVFGILGVVVAATELSKSNKDRINTSSTFNSFKNNYLFVYSLMMAGDWLQGPYVYYLYSTYGYGKGDIGQLFIAGFGSSMLFGTIVGSLADKQGRKRACVTYCITYILSCITKHSPQYKILMLGRILGGIATSLLFSAFESWLVAEHNKRGFEQQWLSITFSKAIFLGNGVVAILAGLLGNTLVDALALGPVAPFDAASCFLTIGMFVILFSWTENYGDPSENKDLLTQFRGAAVAIASDEKIALLGAIQSLFEGSMYTFVFLWTPALSPNDEDIPHGFIFATFMLSSMFGSSLASRLMARQAPRVESYMQIVFAISAASLLLPIVTSFLVAPSKEKGGSISFAGCIQLLGFCAFEACVGLFWPSIMKMRSQYIPEEARSTIMNFFRIPLNIFVCIVLYNVDAFPMTVMFGMCSIFLFVACFLQRRLMAIADKPKTEDWVAMKERDSEAEPLNI